MGELQQEAKDYLNIDTNDLENENLAFLVGAVIR